MADWRDVLTLGATCKAEYAAGGAQRVAWPLRVRRLYEDIVHLKAAGDRRRLFALQFKRVADAGFFNPSLLGAMRREYDEGDHTFSWGEAAVYLPIEPSRVPSVQVRLTRRMGWASIDNVGIATAVLAAARRYTPPPLIDSGDWPCLIEHDPGFTVSSRELAALLHRNIKGDIVRCKPWMIDVQRLRWIALLSRPVGYMLSCASDEVLERVRDAVDEDSRGTCVLEDQPGIGWCVVPIK